MAAVMLFSGYANAFNLLTYVQRGLSKIIKNNKLLLVVLSAIGGVLPIPGRAIASAGLLDSIIGQKSKLRPKFGILNYLATHHYYLWSPLEKTVIIPMAVLNVSYLGLLGYTWPLILITLAMLVGYIIIGMRNVNVDSISVTVSKNQIKTLNPFKIINWPALLFVYGAIVAGNFVKTHSSQITEWVQTFDGSFIMISLAGFVAAWLMGSSSKFAGLVSILVGLYGIEYFVYFFAIEYAGYLLSPMHKCNAISCGYFKTPIIKYVTVLIIWAIALIIYGITTII